MSRILLIRLGCELELALALEEPRGSLALFGDDYSEVHLGRENLLGCYDWLRDPGGRLVGFRLWIDTPSLGLAKMIPQRPYISYDSLEVFRVMFRVAESIDDETSMDQDFGHTRAFINPEGEVVLSVDAEGLSPDEFDALGKDSLSH